jgi:hypothetical protein
MTVEVAQMEIDGITYKFVGQPESFKAAMVTNYPLGKECMVCGHTIWWLRFNKDGQAIEWICGTCHPSPDPLEMVKNRILKGNWVLYVAKKQYFRMPAGSPERAEALVSWMAASDKLKQLSDSLKVANRTDCLYIENHKKVRLCLHEPECIVCPNNYWWEKELFDDNQEYVNKQEEVKNAGRL